MPDDIDPEIAALIGGIEEYTPKQGGSKPPAARAVDGPSFESLFGDMSVTGEVAAKGEFEVDFSKKAYEPIAVFEQEPPDRKSVV